MSNFGKNPTTNHAPRHELGGADELDLTGLPGVLGDEQDAGLIKGTSISLSGTKQGDSIYYDAFADQWKNQPLNFNHYNIVLGSDWSPTVAELKAHGSAFVFSTFVFSYSHVGNGTVAYLNGIVATLGDTYTVTDSGVLTIGSLVVTPGTIVAWAGTAWIYVLPPSATGFVPPGVRVVLSTTTPLIAPYTDGVDDGKLIAFDGTDNTGFETPEDITITLPDPSGFDKDHMIYGPIYCGKLGEAGEVIIQIDGGGTFVDGLVDARLSANAETLMIGATNGDFIATWIRMSELLNVLQVRRNATWDASNFATATALPFSLVDVEENANISSWSAGTPSRLTVSLSGYYDVSGFVSFLSNERDKWSVFFWLLKNGTTEIPGGKVYTGDREKVYSSATLSPIVVYLEAGDYLEWVFEHDGFAGSLYAATIVAKRRY